MNFPRSAWGALPLRLPAWVYGAVARRSMQRKLRNAAHASIPVVSVGNLTVGGTGKTPLVGWIAERYQQAGLTPAIVSRGYGGRAGAGPIVVSQGEQPLIGAEVAGDEPFLLATRLPGVRVVVGSARLAGVERAAALGARVAILDDGFQHQQLARELDIVLIDGSQPFGNGYLLPAGPLREPPESLSRAGIVIVTRSPKGVAPELERRLRRHAPDALLMSADHRTVGTFDAQGRSVPMPERLLAFCGIGNPERFRRDLESGGTQLVEFLPYRDHHRFTLPELASLARRAERANARLVTTEKDLARIGPKLRPTELFVLRIAFEPGNAAALERALLDCLSSERK